jgi:hypothetical protein
MGPIDNLVIHLLAPFRIGTTPCNPLRLPDRFNLVRTLDPDLKHKLRVLCDQLKDKDDPRKWNESPNSDRALCSPTICWATGVLKRIFSSLLEEETIPILDADEFIR